MSVVEITEHEFLRFQKLLFEISGISLSDAKKPLVLSRLSKRLRVFGLGSLSEYLKLLDSHEFPDELQTAVDLLTTNETYFFREPNHFDFLRNHLEKRDRSAGEFRVWSAACSSGQEPYSVAMLLDDCLGNRDWQIVASDISTEVLNKAHAGLYPLAQSEKIPRQYLNRYCLKGVGHQEGNFRIDSNLRTRIKFSQINLNTQLPQLGQFDVVFLRNVMIYFNQTTKQLVASRLINCLKSGGYLFIGHSETLNGITNQLKMIAPAIYQKP